MYCGQQLYTSPLQCREVAAHCRHILAMADLVVATQDIEQHHVIFSVFLAGVNSSNDQDKKHAIAIMRAMEGTGISCNVIKCRELLEAVYAEQSVRVQSGGNAAEVDWVTFARERGIRLVNFGL